MRVYVQGLSALAHYRSSSAKMDIERCSTDLRALEGATSSRAAIIDEGIWRLGIGEPSLEKPLEVLVHKSGQRSRSRAVHARVWQTPIALTAFREISRSIYVSSPEFVFLQMATRLSLPELAALGMELCGTYRRDVEVPHIDSDEPDHITVYDQPPLSTPRRIRGFLESMQSAPGQAKALRALEYVLPNSASPMETAIFLLLCLPRRLGGYALPKPTLNPSITLSKSGKKHTLRSSARPDLYWASIRLDLEFNSDEFHDEARRTLDSMRRKALERMGVEVIELTREELFSPSLFHATALRIARRLGKKIRPESERGFVERRASLREQILLEQLAKSSDGEREDRGARQTKADRDSFDEELSNDWLDELPSDDEWLESSWDADDPWTAEIEPLDDDDLHVFGAGRREEE